MTTDGSTSPATLEAELVQLRGELELLQAQRDELLQQHQQKNRTIEGLQHQLQQLLRRMYGRSSEKVDPQQMALFEKLLEQLAPSVPERVVVQPVPAEAASRAQGHGRRRLPSDLPRQKVIHDLPEQEKPCPCCGKLRHVIGQEISEQLDYVPARLTVIEHIRLKYACKACEASASEMGPQIATAEKPLSPIEKGLAGPGLLAYVIVSKYGDHLPLHRLEKILERHHIDIARSTMCDWMAQCAEVLKPLYHLMVKEVLQSRVIHTDDTPVDVLDRSLNQTRTGRFWVYLGDPGHPCNLFAYTPSRSRDGPMKFLAGWGKEERRYLQADAFGGYDGIYAGEAGAPPGNVTEVACWAHARRKFYDARSSDEAIAAAALAYIRLLYDVEDQVKEMKPDERVMLRQQLAVPRLEEFKSWLESQQASRGGPVLPKSPTGQAITYALNQWDALTVYTSDGNLAIDNNASENALRRIALGRKNWLFCGSDTGGHTAAVLFTFIATCQRHKVNAFDYLRDLLARIAAHPINRLDELLPNRWQPAPPSPSN
jgi:transposase